MLSNVTKSADVLRGETQWQDLWAEVEKEHPVKGLPGPRVLQSASATALEDLDTPGSRRAPTTRSPRTCACCLHRLLSLTLSPLSSFADQIMVGKVMNEQERREELERLAHIRQQRNNFDLSESAKTLKNRRSNLSSAERKSIRERLTRRSAYSKPKPKSEVGLGFVLKESAKRPGERLPWSPDGQPSLGAPKRVDGAWVPQTVASGLAPRPKSKAVISPPGAVAKTARQLARGENFQGLTRQEWFNEEWHTSLPYRPAAQTKPWEELDGFSKSTRTLERRKLNPFLDINSFTGNKHSALAQFDSHAHVRPLDNKGNLGAKPVQDWKESLREDFARDDDNHSSNAHDANLDALRKAMGGTDFFSDIE